MLFSRINGKDHQERLESFYSHQAHLYDDSRTKLLHGRRLLIESLIEAKLIKGNWLDIGAGTGFNLSLAEKDAKACEKIVLLDLSSSLLKQARARVLDLKLTNVEIVEKDCEKIDFAPNSFNLITFSYSLTMIPNWFIALEKAYNLLAPGGVIGITDFFVSRKYESENHNWFTRTLIPLFFAFDNVNLSADHLPWLKSHFEEILIERKLGSLPFLPLVKAPYYLFIGRKI